MKLLVQPEDGISTLVKAINKAKKSVEIVIFRFDLTEIEHALESAVERGVLVHALIASTNRGGEKTLRKLELRLLESGVTVARTADDLVRYHGKMMVIDRKELFLLAFNYTRLDTQFSRSFAIITKNRQLVQEAVKLFEADTKRQSYTAGSRKFLVSPINARKELTSFIKGAKKEILIYDLKISDRAIIRALEERARAGVKVRVIGHVAKRSSTLESCAFTKMRLHTRALIRDRSEAFLGSQSMRTLELDARREIGAIFRDAKAIGTMVKVFEDDWKTSEPVLTKENSKPVQDAKKIAKAATKGLSVAPVVEHVMKQVLQQKTNVELDEDEVHDTVRAAVKEAVKEAVKDAVKVVASKVAAENEAAK